MADEKKSDQEIKPKHTIIINIFDDGSSNLFPSAKLHPDFMIDVLNYHVREIERGMLIAEVFAELNKPKIYKPH